MERWFGREVEVSKVSKAEFHSIWDRNKNKGRGDSYIMSKCYLKGIPNTTIGGVRDIIDDNFWEALSIF